VTKDDHEKAPHHAVCQQFAAAVREVEAAGGLPAFTAESGPWGEFWRAEAHHSTALEGNSLTGREVDALLETRRAVGARDLKDYMEVFGYAEAARWVLSRRAVGDGRALAGDGRALESGESGEAGADEGKGRTKAGTAAVLITETELRHLHRLALGPAWDVAPPPDTDPAEGPGEFRRCGAGQFPNGVQPPDHPTVAALVRDWIDAVNAFGRAIGDGTLPLEEAPLCLARIHATFERIHPFLDGSGRVGRLALNLVLTRLGWPPVVVLSMQRDRYLKSLAKADAGDLGPLGALIAQASVTSAQLLAPDSPADGALLPLAELAGERMSLAALRQAVSRGRLRASLDANGAWHTSREAVDAYLTSRQRRNKPDTHSV
jgi:hypothetical protein